MEPAQLFHLTLPAPLSFHTQPLPADTEFGGNMYFPMLSRGFPPKVRCSEHPDGATSETIISSPPELQTCGAAQGPEGGGQQHWAPLGRRDGGTAAAPPSPPPSCRRRCGSPFPATRPEQEGEGRGGREAQPGKDLG